MQGHPSGPGEHHGGYAYAWPPPPGFPYMPTGAHPYGHGQPPMPYQYPPQQQHVGHVVSPGYAPVHAQPGPAAAPRPKRRRITPEQLEILTGVFADQDTPGYEMREKLAGQLNMTIREVQNRRAKVNRERLQAQQQAQIEIQRQQLEAAKAALEGMGATGAAERLSPLPSSDGPVMPLTGSSLLGLAAPKLEAEGVPSSASSEPSLKPPTPPSRLDATRPVARRASSASQTSGHSSSGPTSAPLPQAGPSLAAYPHYAFAGQHPVQHTVDPYGRTSPHPQYVYGHPQMYMPAVMVQSPGVPAPLPLDPAGASRSYMDRPPSAPQQAWQGQPGYRSYGAYEEAAPASGGASPGHAAYAMAQAHAQAAQAPAHPQGQPQPQTSAQGSAQPTQSPHGHPLTLPPLWSLGFNGQHQACVSSLAAISDSRSQQQQTATSAVGRGPSGSHPDQAPRKHSLASSSGGSRGSLDSPPATGTNATEFTPSTAGDDSVHVKAEADE